MHHSAVLILSGVLALGSLPVLAQSRPSSEQIIKSLTPTDLGNTTRGIRMVHPGETAHAHAGGSAGAATAPSVNLTVLFATDSADLTPDATQVLDQLGHALSSQQLGQYRFRIEGHTDTVGTPQYNQALSQRRADAVVGYLEGKFGIAGSRLQAVGVGESGLLVQTPNNTPEARNRRVQVVNIGS